MKSVRILGVLLAVAVGALVGVGCDDKEVPYVVDADELIRYISESEDAQELFRTTGLINPDPYEFSFDSAVFRDSLLRHERSIRVDVTGIDDTPYTDYGGTIGQVRDAWVYVTDVFTIQISRTYADTIILDTTDFGLTRYGVFLKLGGDSRPWVGWVLYEFNGGDGGSHFAVQLESSSGVQFAGGGIIRVGEIDTVLQGDSLTIHTRMGSGGQPTFQLVSDFTNEGPFTRAMHRYDTIEFRDSLSYQTRSGNPLFYNLVFFQMIRTDSLYPDYRRSFAVPYRW